MPKAFIITCAEMPYYGRRYGRMSVRQREGIAMLALRRYQAGLRAKAKAARARRMTIMREKRVARRLFSQPGAFSFKAPNRTYAKYRREAAVAKRLFSQPGAFKFRPSWRGVKRKRGKEYMTKRKRRAIIRR